MPDKSNEFKYSYEYIAWISTPASTFFESTF
jgi:hypothetical protein